MKPLDHNSPLLPLHDYKGAVQGAVSWLGDRYLLAEPVVRRREAHDAAPFFNQARRWQRQSIRPR
jgi:hypothetical protein